MKRRGESWMSNLVTHNNKKRVLSYLARNEKAGYAAWNNENEKLEAVSPIWKPKKASEHRISEKLNMRAHRVERAAYIGERIRENLKRRVIICVSMVMVINSKWLKRTVTNSRPCVRAVGNAIQSRACAMMRIVIRSGLIFNTINNP